jgi:glycerophosphoryl diester phosphodiesterase
MRRVGSALLAFAITCALGGVAGSVTVALPKPYVSADQGGGGYAPENTMVAFRNAIRLGVDELETDVNITADGQLVIIHDDSLNRTTNCRGIVHRWTLAEVERCDAAYWWTPGVVTLLPGAAARLERDTSAPHPLRGKGVRVPTVREFFSYVVSLGDRAPQFSIEIKNIPYDTNFDPLGHRIADALVPLIHEYGLTRKAVVESFWPASLSRVKRLDPAIRTMFLTLGSALANFAYVAVTPTEFSSSDTIAPDLGRFYVRHVHALGKKVVPWLVDARSDWDKVKGLGVDGVISSYPACILKAMGRPVSPPYVTPEAGLSYDLKPCP